MLPDIGPPPPPRGPLYGPPGTAVPVKVISPAGDVHAELDWSNIDPACALKAQLTEICKVPVGLQTLLVGGKVWEDADTLSEVAEDCTPVIITMVVGGVTYAFATGSWEDIWATGEDATVLRGEDVGRKIILEGRSLKIEEAYEGPAVDGDATIWVQWATGVTLGQPIVLGFRLSMPDNNMSCCTIGLTTANNLSSLQGGSSVAHALTNWTSPFLAYSPSSEDLEEHIYSRTQYGYHELLGERLESTDGCEIVLAFHRSRHEVIAARGFTKTRLDVPEDMWPDAGQELFPFVAICSEEFHGFEELDQENLPVLIEALSESDARPLAGDFLLQVSG